MTDPEQLRHLCHLAAEAVQHHEQEHGFTDPLQSARLKSLLSGLRELRINAPETPADARVMAAEQRRRAMTTVQNEE